MEEFNDLSKIHIGKRIKEVLKQKEISVSQLAKSISHSRCTVYDIFNRKSVDTELLIHISHALGYNFLREAYFKKTDNIENKTVNLTEFKRFLDDLIEEQQ